MKYCANCGSDQIRRVIPLGDIGLRYACASCQTIHYRNPNIVAGCIAVWDSQVLLCRRAIEPFQGMWTIPAGYLEMGETIEEAAIREAHEEANASLGRLRVFALYNLPTFAEVYALFATELIDPAVAPGDESLEVRLWAARDIPWNSIAFPMVREALRHWVAERPGIPPEVDTADFIWGPEGAVRVRRPHGISRLVRQQ